MANANWKMKWVICSCCESHGKVENPAFSNGFTSSEWEQMDHDERDNYLAGGYDVVCPDCKGSGKVAVPNIEMMTFAERRVLAANRRDARMEAMLERESAYERRMGC